MLAVRAESDALDRTERICNLSTEQSRLGVINPGGTTAGFF